MLKGITVHHTTFGAGTVVAETDDTVSINFKGAGGRGATRKFMTSAIFADEAFPKALNAAAWATRKPKGPERPA